MQLEKIVKKEKAITTNNNQVSVVNAEKLISMAIDKNLDVEKLESLLDMQERLKKSWATFFNIQHTKKDISGC